MPSPISSRTNSEPITPYDPEGDVCREPQESADPSTLSDGAPDSSSSLPAHQPAGDASAAAHDVDYYTVCVGAGAIIGGGVCLTLDRNGHTYLGLDGGVGLSATVGSGSIVGGKLVDGSDGRPSEEHLRSLLTGDSIGGSAAFGYAAGVTNAAAGTAVEAGVGLVQAEVHFQHSWHLADVPVRW